MTSSTTSGGVTRDLRFDARSGEVRINGQPAGVATRDSTLIVMVDRVDNIGGPPVTTTISVAAIAAAAIPSGRDRVDSATGAVIPISAGAGLVRVLQVVPAVAEFIR